MKFNLKMNSKTVKKGNQRMIEFKSYKKKKVIKKIRIFLNHKNNHRVLKNK